MPLTWLIRFSFRTLFPTGGDLPGVAETDLGAYVDLFLREAGFMMRLGLVLSCLVFVCCPILTVYVPLPAFLLPRSWRERHARKAAAHPLYLIRQTTTMLKMIAGICWAQDPAVRTRLGLRALKPDPGTWRPSS